MIGLVRSSDEAGNTLALVPVALLLVLGLAALAIDATALFLAERQLHGMAASVATDAAGTLDRARFYAPEGEIVLDAVAAQQRADAMVSHHDEDAGVFAPSCQVTIEGPVAVVTCQAEVRPLLPLVWSDLPRRVHLSATERAVALDPDN